MKASLFIIVICLSYLSVSLKTYISFRKSGLLKDAELAKRYFLYVFFWPAYINPFNLIAEKLFQTYGDRGHIYPGWVGLRNFLNDVLKGKNRYNNYENHNFNVELTKSPDINFKNHRYARLHLAIKGKRIILICNISDSPQKERHASRFELDRAKCIDHPQLINKLKSLNVKCEDIERITSTIH